MTPENFEQMLLAFSARRPFKVFTIELLNGNRVEVDHPMGVAYKDGLAIGIAPGPVPVYFDHESVVQIIDSPAHSAP